MSFSSSQTVEMKMAASTSSFPLQSSTYKMKANTPSRPCEHRCYPCSICLTIMSCLVIAMGAAVLAIALARKKTISDGLYEHFPEIRKSAHRQFSAGIAVVVFGIILFIVSVVWCFYIKKSTSSSGVYAGVAMTSTSVFHPSGSSSKLDHPPESNGKGSNSQPLGPLTSIHPNQAKFLEAMQHEQPVSNHPSAYNRYSPVLSTHGQYSPDKPASKRPSSAYCLHSPVQSIRDQAASTRPSSAYCQYSPVQSTHGHYSPDTSKPATKRPSSTSSQYSPVQSTHCQRDLSMVPSPASPGLDSPPPSYTDLMQVWKKSTVV